MKELPEDFSAWCDREREAGRMADIDRGLLFLTRRSHPENDSEEENLLVLVMVAILSRARREGHVLIDLDEVQNHPWVLSWKDRLPDPSRWEATSLSPSFSSSGNRRRNGSSKRERSSRRSATGRPYMGSKGAKSPCSAISSADSVHPSPSSETLEEKDDRIHARTSARDGEIFFAFL